jgi:hypothetical protein
MRSARFIAHDLRSGRFCANLLRISNFSHTVKLKLSVFIAVHAAQSLKQQPAEIDRIRPSQYDSRDTFSRVLQWFCSLWDSRQGS